jgi:hypothetical protein
MTDPTTPHPAHPADDHLDAVPGDPPVPITVWRTPAEAGGLSPRLAARLLAAYTRPGDTVHDTTADPALADAIAAAGRRLASDRRGADPADPAALAVTGWPPTHAGVDPVIVLGALRRRLRPSGVLVAVIANPTPGAGPVDAGPLVRAARQARLSYLQHIVAVTAPVDGDRITAPPGVDQPRGGGTAAAHLRVHTDLLVFANSHDRRG